MGKEYEKKENKEWMRKKKILHIIQLMKRYTQGQEGTKENGRTARRRGKKGIVGIVEIKKHTRKTLGN